MKEILVVGVGGFVGSAARYYLGGLAFQLAGAPRFPISTLIVNISGCLLIRNTVRPGGASPYVFSHS